jgi:hypothetical protein
MKKHKAPKGFGNLETIDWIVALRDGLEYEERANCMKESHTNFPITPEWTNLLAIDLRFKHILLSIAKYTVYLQ